MKPDRYARFREYASSRLGRGADFDLAFRQIEAIRLEAESECRASLAQYWLTPTQRQFRRSDKLESLRPLDLLVHFRTYAERVFKATGSECVRLFHDAESYESFLHLVAEWVVEQILPQAKTPREEMAEMRALCVHLLDLTERIANSNVEGDAKAEMKGIAHYLKTLLGEGLAKEITDEKMKLLRAARQSRTIRLRESIAELEVFRFSGNWRVSVSR